MSPESTVPASGGAGVHVALRDIVKSFRGVPAVRDFSLEVARGSFTTILGLSGCGKTTVLRIVAGFLDPDSGSVTVSGRDQADVPPDRRGIGMVFQDYALFPHMSVLENVAYGLKTRGVRSAERQRIVAEALESLGLGELGARYPHELSGGQQQRVALGRALVLRPEVLLMDEPLSNLDAKLRVRVREELKAIQTGLGITTIYVTHDQEEAFALSDLIAVMDGGKLLQLGDPATIYRSPRDGFVADFVGSANFLPAAAEARGAGSVATRTAAGTVWLRAPEGSPTGPGRAMARPEWFSLSGPSPTAGPSDGSLAVPAVVEGGEFHGARIRYRLRSEAFDEPIVVDEAVDVRSAARPKGARVLATLPAGTGWWIPG